MILGSSPFFMSFFHYILIDFLFLPFIVILPVLLATAFFTLAERKLMASIQRRSGPGIVGFWGVLQPIADGLKLLTKEGLIPSTSLKIFWHLSPFASLLCCFMGWFVINFNLTSLGSTLNYGVIFIFLWASLNVYWIFLAGWFTRSHYSVLGSLRGISQLISYELLLGLLIQPICFLSGSLNIDYIIQAQFLSSWFCFFLLPCACFYFICLLAETNRIPFDLLEAEAELVGGYYTEFGSFWFASFFLSEYGNMLLGCSLYVSLFFGGGYVYSINLNQNNIFFDIFYDGVFVLKILFFIFLLIYLRANLPRYRFDHIMLIGWKVILPILLCLVYTLLGFLLLFESYNIIQMPMLNSKYLYIFTNSSVF